MRKTRASVRVFLFLHILDLFSLPSTLAATSKEDQSQHQRTFAICTATQKAPSLIRWLRGRTIQPMGIGIKSRVLLQYAEARTPNLQIKTQRLEPRRAIRKQMTFSKIGRIASALVATAALGLGMTACGGGTIGYLWSLGTYYNQISGFKIDSYTGNLTAIDHAPFSSGGVNPVLAVLKPGGRYLYVINNGTAGSGTVGTPGYVAPVSGSIAEFAVGGGGVLTFQQNFFSQGTNSIYATLDGSGNFLYVLDKFGPNYNAVSNPNGSITAFSIAADTGRLTLVPNTTILNPNGTPTNFFAVGANPIMSKIGGGNCLFTLSPNSIYPYSISGNGQLTIATTGPYLVPGSQSLTSINTSAGTSAGTFTYLTDGAANQIFSLQAGGTACSLSPISGSQQNNLPGASNPVNSITTQNGRYLYVLNQVQTGQQSTSTSSISAFFINGNGQIQQLAGSDGQNPYAVGAGPVCAVQDPTNQYLFISNSLDNTVTGKIIDQNHGYLANLTRGSVFSVTKTPTCLVSSPNV